MEALIHIKDVPNGQFYDRHSVQLDDVLFKPSNQEEAKWNYSW